MDAGGEDTAPKASSGNIFAGDLGHQVATAARDASSSGVSARLVSAVRTVPGAVYYLSLAF
jgi:hypothetical protein